MEIFLSHCSTYLSTSTPVVASVMVAGLIGSMSHCSVMCSPLVAAQMMSLNETRTPQSMMVYYHVGRITIYAVLGVIAFLFAHLIFAGTIRPYANGLLMLAGATFITSAARPRKTHACCSGKLKNIQRMLNTLSWQRVGYFVRGMLMGLMPCGMVYAVLIAVAMLNHPLEAALVMAAFGLVTVPALHAAGWTALSLGKKYPTMSAPVSRCMMACNGLFLCALGTNAVNVS